MESASNPSENRIGPIFESEVMIRESHLDSFGHVNNAAYLQIFEEARWDIISGRGFGLNDIHSKKIGPVILGVQIQFRKELRNREVITIRSWTTSVASKISTMRQVMVNSKGEEACVADFTFGLFDLTTRKLIAPIPEWKHALGLDL